MLLWISQYLFLTLQITKLSCIKIFLTYFSNKKADRDFMNKLARLSHDLFARHLSLLYTLIYEDIILQEKYTW
jgi:hypothetical protein